MQLATHPTLTTTIALTSAAILAAGPITQHVPDLHAAQQVSQVGVADIQLTGAADSVLDLFSGVESDLASLAGGAAVAAVPASLAGAALDPTQNLIVQTWVNALTKAGTNLQSIYNTWSKTPFPVLQQLAANGVSYANLYVSTYQIGAQAAVKYFFGTSPTQSFGPLLQSAWTDFLTGKITTAVSNLFLALYQDPLVEIGLPMEPILNIPQYITQNLANATKNLLQGWVSLAGELVVFGPSAAIAPALGNSLQAASSAWGAGNPVVALTNLLNTPGATVNGFLNGAANGTFGLLSNPLGLLNQVVNTLAPSLAQVIVAPNATNIVTGGSLQAAVHAFGNQLINGWPSLTPVITGIGSQISAALQAIPSVLSNLPSILGNIGGALVSNIGLLIANLLKLL